ncbi:hypothetical protein [Georgenia halophila]
MKPTLHIVVLAALSLLLAACGGTTRVTDPGRSEPGPGPTAADGSTVTTRLPTTVLDDGDGAELCLGAVAESLPPQCGGPKLLGWDWADQNGSFEEVDGVRWGQFLVVGEYDGSDITVTDVTRAAVWQGPAPEEPGFSTPCAEPDGGWQVVDPQLTGEEAMNDALAVTAGLEGYAGSWVDQSVNPASGGDPEEVERAMNDPTKLVLNVRVAGEPAVAEERLREVWGGALCVSAAERTEAELLELQEQLGDLPGLLSSGVSVVQNRLDVQVTYDDGTLQERLDAEHGDGAVHVESALIPAM